MKVIFYLPPGTRFEPSLEGYHLVEAISGEIRSLLIDKNFATWEIVPEVPVPPTPPPVQTELYKVVSTGRLNVRVDHSTTAEIKDRLDPGEEFALIIGQSFDDTTNAILWRKLVSGWWVAVSRGGDVYAEKVDTSTRGG